MSKPKLIIMDFDRTIFNAAFYTEFLALLTSRRLLDAATNQRIVDLLADTNISLDLMDVLRRCHLNVVQALELARTALDPNDFLYDDVSPFLERGRDDKLVVMTTGVRRWQMIKLDFCASLQPYPKIILQDNKGEYVRDTLLQSQKGISIQDYEGQWFSELVLIDDRVDSLTPLVGRDRVSLWHLERPDAKYRRDRDYDGITHITSLKEII
ncbi:MAG TPA: hypothetical protein VLI05_02170 [Candidatus Saccharimonadia bacterium]|nr:hypothetical protein [Candidatus Saccharimonadia bacterium]